MKKIVLEVLLLLDILYIIGIYIIGGQISPWIWSACVFIIAPIASISLIAQIIVVIIRICKGKNIKMEPTIYYNDSNYGLSNYNTF